MTRSPDLTTDCSGCAALCCVVFAFDKSESFAIDKAAGETCPNLDACGKCRVFSDREALGFHGCIAYDCHGAGQVISQNVFQGRSWRDEPSLTKRMGDALSVLRRVHEQLLLLQVAETLPLSEAERSQLASLRDILLPGETWTEASLQAFPLDRTVKEVGEFLTGLRRHVAGSANGRR